MFRIVAALVVLSLASFAQPSTQQVAGLFAAYQGTNKPGCAVGIEPPGQPILTAAYGMADLEHAVANTPETIFEVGSVSKQFTAAAVLLLVQRGKISLDDDMRRYFPELPAYERPITVRHLLNHTSGLRDWGEIEEIAGWPRTTREYTHAHVLEILSRQHALNYAPGEKWSYTNSGYNLAAMLVERVTGAKLQAFCRKEFFEPLGMNSTQWRDDFRRIVPKRAVAYDAKESVWYQDMPFEDVYGNGGLLSTVSDLLKWNRNMQSGKLHSDVFRQMQKPGALNDGSEIRYGFGLFLYDFLGLPEISHGGATGGYRAWLGRIPSKDLSIALACNAGTADTSDLADHIAALYLGVPVPQLPPAPKDFTPGMYRDIRDHTSMHVYEKKGHLYTGRYPFRVPARLSGNELILSNPVYGQDVCIRVKPWKPEDVSEFAGIYVSNEAQTTLTVSVQNGKLVLHRSPDDNFDLKPAETDWFESDLADLHFIRDASGKVSSLSVSGSRVWDLRFERMNGGSEIRDMR
jgi:CubicO group peptidase (beta-lactamase class C family)